MVPRLGRQLAVLITDRDARPTSSPLFVQDLQRQNLTCTGSSQCRLCMIRSGQRSLVTFCRHVSRALGCPANARRLDKHCVKHVPVCHLKSASNSKFGRPYPPATRPAYVFACTQLASSPTHDPGRVKVFMKLHRRVEWGMGVRRVGQGSDLLLPLQRSPTPGPQRGRQRQQELQMKSAVGVVAASVIALEAGHW